MATREEERHRHHAERYRDTVRLLLTCPDRPGIVARVAKFFSDHGGNITRLAEYCTSERGGQFFMRVEAVVPDLVNYAGVLEAAFPRLFDPSWQVDFAFRYPARLKRLAIFCSRTEHCLLELLWQWRAGDLMADIRCVIGNHEACRAIVESMGLPFYKLLVTPEEKAEAEAQQLEILERERVDLIALARYMQILTPDFVRRYPHRIINIHHSFLPAFVGGDPYRQAYERGVKLIGATAHYVTAALDEGPIIEQDVHRVTHRDRVEDLRRQGRHLERTALARAVAWHLEDRILVHNNKTVLFD